jgi:tryptophan synthase alpha chain
VSRIATKFAALKAKNRKAFITFTSAGDPDLETFTKILAGQAAAGVDLIEIGMPFSDPVADGPAIEKANLRAFVAGITMQKILGIVANFRKTDKETPVILMGYANPVYAYGLEKFVGDAHDAGVDGLIIADLPPEEDAELRSFAVKKDMDVIRLLTPTTDEKRLPVVLNGASGFLYYVSVAGITGTKQAGTDSVRRAVDFIRANSKLPVGVGFGIATPEQAQEIAKHADAVIVGSAIVNRIAANLDDMNKPKSGLVENVLGFIESLAQATHNN